MIAMPSSSTATMKVSRNWPSGIIGRISPRRRRRRSPRRLGPVGDAGGCRTADQRLPSGRCCHATAEPASGRRNRPIDRVRRRRPPAADRGAGEHAGDRHRLRLAGAAVERRELQLRRRPAAERVGERAAQHLVHQRLLEEAHFGLGRMHVDVDAVGRNLDEQMDLRAALLDRRDAVGLGNRVRDRAVPDDAAVDEDVLRAAHGPVIAERRDVAVNRDARRVLAELEQIRPIAEQLEEALRQSRRGRTLEQPAAAERQRPADLRIAERQLRDEPRDLRGLRRRRTSGTCAAPAG